MKLKIISTRTSLLILIGAISLAIFLWRNTENTEQVSHSVPIRVGTMIDYLEFSPGYYTEYSPPFLTIHVELPNLLPNNPSDAFDVNKSARILIRTNDVPENDALKSTLRVLNLAPCQDESCLKSLEGPAGHHKALKAKSVTGKSKYYLITAYDGAQVLVEDPGKWAKSYEFTRRLDGLLNVFYQIPKSQTEDFRASDKLLTEFIKRNMRYEKFRSQYG